MQQFHFVKELSMTSLRQRLTEDMQVRNLALNTQTSYVQQVSLFARHFNKSPEALGPEDIRAYQVYLTNEKKAGRQFHSHRCCGTAFPVLLYSPCPKRSPGSSLRTRRSSTAFSSARRRKLLRPLRPTQSTSEPRLASSPCFTVGDKTCFSIPTSIVSCPAEACLPMVNDGSRALRISFCPSGFCPACSDACSWNPSRRHSMPVSCSLQVTWNPFVTASPSSGISQH